jgi:hypothetical protein
MTTNGNETISSEVADDFLATLCRGLSDDNKFSRKGCLVKIRSSINERSSEEEISKAFEVVFKDVLRSFKDPSEACRENAILLVSDVIGKVPSVEPFLTFIITVVAKRIGLDDEKEPAEEIRLLLIKLVIALLKNSADCNLTPCLDDLSTILCKGLADNFPEMKLASCECTKLLASTIPKQFHVQSETYLKALIPGAVHKHSKVRTAFISTIGTDAELLYLFGKSANVYWDFQVLSCALVPTILWKKSPLSWESACTTRTRQFEKK